MEDALIEEPAMRCFAGINLISDRIPAETTILSNFLRRNAMRSTRRQPGLQILRRLAGGDGTAAALPYTQGDLQIAGVQSLLSTDPKSLFAGHIRSAVLQGDAAHGTDLRV
jgi:hypothetical protein